VEWSDKHASSSASLSVKLVDRCVVGRVSRPVQPLEAIGAWRLHTDFSMDEFCKPHTKLCFA
jgi:hypothetical protein